MGDKRHAVRHSRDQTSEPPEIAARSASSRKPPASKFASSGAGDGPRPPSRDRRAMPPPRRTTSARIESIARPFRRNPPSSRPSPRSRRGAASARDPNGLFNCIDAPVQDAGETDPRQIGRNDRGRGRDQCRDERDEREDRKPERHEFVERPVRPAQLEEQRAPEHVQHAVDRKERDQQRRAWSSARVPGHHAAGRDEQEDQRPGRAEQPVRRPQAGTAGSRTKARHRSAGRRPPPRRDRRRPRRRSRSSSATKSIMAAPN